MSEEGLQSAMAEDPKEVVHRLVRLLNERRVAELDEVLTAGRRFKPGGARSVRRFFAKLNDVFPDHAVFEQALISEGDQVALLASVIGTHSGRILEVAPTRQQVSFRTMHLWRAVDGRLTEHTGATDLFGLLLQLGVVPGTSATPEPLSRVQAAPAGSADVKSVAKRFHEGAWAGSRTDLASLLTADYLDHTPYVFEGRNPGPEGRLRALEMVKASFSDLASTVDLQIAEGDLVVSAVTTSGTHTGKFLGTEPTGRAVRLSGINLERVSGTRVQESWHVEDLAALARQLGAI
ncbi:MAG: ester cyclase family protein [Actinomycetota bacterium]